MKPALFWRRVWVATAVCLVFAGIDGPAKPIRLRNQTIPTTPATSATRAPAAPGHGSPFVSGLYLVQFRQPPGPETRALLGVLGVDLLHYVPDDAFVARLHNTRLGTLTTLPFVEWVGEYRPEHKVHSALKSAAQAQAIVAPMGIAVLLAPRTAAAEIARVRGALASVQQESSLRSGTVLRGKVTPAQLNSLAASDAVLWIEPVRDMKLIDEVSSKIVAGDGGPNKLYTQSLGYDGSGVNVAVADSGLNNGDAATMHPDLFGRTPAFFAYGGLPDAADEHSHGTHVSGIIAGNGATGEVDDNGALYGLGVAPGASIIAQRIFDGAGNYYPPPSYEKLTRDATRAGAVIGSNSWGDDTQGEYDLSAMEFDELVRDADALALGDQPYILEFSAGNAGPGPQTIGSPAVAKNVIATGASENDRTDMIIYSDGPEVMADFSSRGPCADGRIKPDVVAPGTWISSLQSESATDQYAWAPIDSYYQYQGGTSQAGPHASGAAAVFVQYYRQTHTNATPSPALVKAALINSAIELDEAFGNDPAPNMDEGWGRVNLPPIFDGSSSFVFLDQTVLLTNGQVFQKHVVVASPSQPLKVTLTYTDPPGLPAAIPALVNDLDLEVVAPDGRLYRGNEFDSGESVPNPPGRDAINNVEGVYVSNPVPGDYLVRVRAVNVVEDARQDTLAIDQDFALVVSAILASPGTSTLLLDRATYTAPSQIKITLINSDLAGHPSATASASSTTETKAELVLLAAAGSSGSFTGAIATATGPPLSDGRLQIANNDVIQVVYSNSIAGSNLIATARADLVPPVLSNIAITNGFGVASVSWSSDEPATSIVRYGTNPVLSSLTFAVTNSDLVTSHSLTLEGLVPGRTYYCYVVSADEAGNLATNNNGGSFFTVIVPPTAAVLLVDDYQPDPYGLFQAPPLSGYTDPLNQIGVTYDVWDENSRGSPTLANLRPYRAVLWRVGDFATPPLTAAERASISNYLADGGGFFMASMEVLSRLDEANATDFSFNVLHVQSYVADTGAAEIIGAAFSPITAGLDIVMNYSLYDNLWGGLVPSDLTDSITPMPGATAILSSDLGDTVGLCWPGLGHQASGRVVFLSTALDAIPMGNGVNDRVNLLRNILAFLAPGAPGLGTLSLDSSDYRLPSVATIQVGDALRAGAGSLSVQAATTTQTNGLSVNLTETATPGVFSGGVTLIAATNPPSAGKLRAKNGDTLTITYFNLSAAALLTATADIETFPPAISNISVQPEYVDAIVSWDTSELTDGLVQFGESTLLGRTAYDPGPATNHSLTLSGLIPDHTYYFQVVSTDLAGNTATDNNHSNLYSFRTFLPLEPPWSDNMESGATNWTVYTSDGSQSQWTLGTPSNGQVTNAHSGKLAWGSNLNGSPIDSVETFLISPAIYLTNGNVAILNFWQAYDFTDLSGYDVQYGEVQIVTNPAAAAVPLQDFTDATAGWEQAPPIDLTPYMGQVVYIVWYYLLIGLDTVSRPGWVIDDVSITVSNVQPGTVQITNNLWQGTYILSGPMYLKNRGLGTVVTNAPPGQYTLEFADVPFYITPAAQTNSLVPGGTISFQGAYTFPDANHNGISDLWEQAFFGNVSPNRTRQTDSNGDGVTDYAAFIAGTNPHSPPEQFRLKTQTLSNSICRISWTAAPGLQFRLLYTTNFLAWYPYNSTWAETNRFDVPLGTLGSRAFFRVQTWTPNLGTNTIPPLAPALVLSAQRLTNIGRFQWPCSIGRAYSLQTSSNLLTWTPASQWMQATTPTTNYSLPLTTGKAPVFFRVQVTP